MFDNFLANSDAPSATDRGLFIPAWREAILAAKAQKEAEEQAAVAAKNAPYERLWSRGAPPPMVQDMDAGAAWWNPQASNGLINRNMVPATPGRGVGRMPSTIIQG
jgi:hypothetical protein